MRSRRYIRGLVGAAVVAGVAFAAAGCGREQPVDLVNGKKLFVGQGTCGACHALARANTNGTQGPSLDDAFAAARSSGMTDKTIEGIVRRQIARPLRGSIMPANLVKGDDARDVAAYVAQAAGLPGEDTGALAQIGLGDAKPVTASAGALTLPADPTGQLAFVSGSASNPGRVVRATAQAGRITFRMPNRSPIQHDIAIADGINAKGPVVGTGGTSEFSATLRPGTYTFLCTVPGHAEGGMTGKLTVK